ncbi:hypothetical protein LIER_40112 [Lithospermum erythrorhizon]|uniref:Uncharacterized protein n=1 Tax=Lithospermum erythrorhizon TaxID=34254 RepID=A0AAV3QPX4_LITER
MKIWGEHRSSSGTYRTSTCITDSCTEELIHSKDWLGKSSIRGSGINDLIELRDDTIIKINGRSMKVANLDHAEIITPKEGSNVLHGDKIKFQEGADSTWVRKEFRGSESKDQDVVELERKGVGTSNIYNKGNVKEVVRLKENVVLGDITNISKLQGGGMVSATSITTTRGYMRLRSSRRICKMWW